MRERLLKLIKEADDICSKTKQCEGCIGFGKGEECVNFLIADHLLANGVIVPPCKVGDVLYVLGTCKDLFLVTTSPCPYEDVCWVTDCNSAADVKRVFPATVECIGIGDHDIYTICFESIDYEYYSTEIGKTVFLSYEEAEAALKGR